MRIKKLLPLAVLACGTASFFALGWHQHFNFAYLQEQNQFLQDFVADNTIKAVLIYMGCYVVVTALSLPIAVPMTLMGGFLFGAAFGTFYTVVAATIGASLVFSAARYAFSDFLEQKVAGFLHRLKQGFTDNAFSYLLTLRLIPLFPFWVVNIVPSFFGVPLWIFASATLVGIAPGTFVFTLAGAGLGEVFATGGEFSAAEVLSPKLLAALVGLGILALLPVGYKFLKNRQNPQ